LLIEYILEIDSTNLFHYKVWFDSKIIDSILWEYFSRIISNYSREYSFKEVILIDEFSSFNSCRVSSKLLFLKKGILSKQINVYSLYKLLLVKNFWKN
jgi:hypothetical protein